MEKSDDSITIGGSIILVIGGTYSGKNLPLGIPEFINVQNPDYCKSRSSKVDSQWSFLGSCPYCKLAFIETELI